MPNRITIADRSLKQQLQAKMYLRAGISGREKLKTDQHKKLAKNGNPY